MFIKIKQRGDTYPTSPKAAGAYGSGLWSRQNLHEAQQSTATVPMSSEGTQSPKDLKTEKHLEVIK